MVSFLYVGKYTPLLIQESMLGWILGYVESSVLADGGFSEPKPVFIPYAFFFEAYFQSLLDWLGWFLPSCIERISFHFSYQSWFYLCSQDFLLISKGM